LSATVKNNGVDGFASLYFNATSTVGGNELGQIFVGQNAGLCLRTSTNHPIRISPNNNEAIVINTDRSVDFSGTVNGITGAMVQTDGAPGENRNVQMDIDEMWIRLDGK
jgi:hypothetical protein